MAERVYNKLVRDNIPDIITESGETPVFRTLENDEYEACLKRKLSEEVDEFIEESTMDELSDILEVLESIANLHGWTDGEIQKVRRDKAESRGAFRERIFLEKVVK